MMTRRMSSEVCPKRRAVHSRPQTALSPTRPRQPKRVLKYAGLMVIDHLLADGEGSATHRCRATPPQGKEKGFCRRTPHTLRAWAAPPLPLLSQSAYATTSHLT